MTVLNPLNVSSRYSTSSDSGSVFGTIASSVGATSAISNIINAQATQSRRTQYFNSVANYIEALRTGQITPKTDWQKTAAYLAKTGQPFVATLNSKGQIQVDRQSDSDMSRYSPAEQTRLNSALTQVASLAKKIQANTTNQSWLDTLDSVEDDLFAFRNHAATPSPGWQQQASILQATGRPLKVGIDGKGNVTVTDQLSGYLPDVPAAQQAKLHTALSQLATTLRTGTATTAWQAQALTASRLGSDYYLDIDQTTQGIVVRTNTADNIVPSFLKTPPYPNLGTDTPWLASAKTFINAGKGFYLDIASNGQIVAKANDGRGLTNYNTPRNQTASNPIISLLA